MSHFTSIDVGTFSITCVATSSVDKLRSTLISQGFTIYEMNGSAIQDKGSFFAQLYSAVSLEPPLPENCSWDVLSDELWQQLMGQPENRAALVWLHADCMLSGRLQLLCDSLAILLDVSRTAARQRRNGSLHPVLFLIFLVGDDENFPSLQ
jgi:hypothetical protein